MNGCHKVVSLCKDGKPRTCPRIGNNDILLIFIFILVKSLFRAPDKRGC